MVRQQISRGISASERALRYVENAPRIQLQDLRDNLGARVKGRQIRASMNQCGHTIGQLQHASKPPLGWIWGDFFKPWHRLFPFEGSFNGDVNVRREYLPLSLLELQRLIDLGWLDQTRLIDLTALCNTRRYFCKPTLRQFGVHLTDEGADCFSGLVNLEVQWASQTAIAAIEKAGGRIRTAYYDICSLEAATNPKKFFLSGQPVPLRKAPPESLISYYTNARNRGYLAQPPDLKQSEKDLANLMGYEYKAFDNKFEKKEPNQVFVGIEPGSLISLSDRKIFLPIHPIVATYYGINGEHPELTADHSFAF